MNKIDEANSRCEYACKLLNEAIIPHVVKNKDIGHINLLFGGKVVMSFWARTGRFIYTVNPTNYGIKNILDSDYDRGIKKCIKTYKETFKDKYGSKK